MGEAIVFFIFFIFFIFWIICAFFSNTKPKKRNSNIEQIEQHKPIKKFEPQSVESSGSNQIKNSNMEAQISAWKSQVDKLVLENTRLRSELHSIKEENNKNKRDLEAEKILYEKSLNKINAMIPEQYNVSEWIERIQAGRLINAVNSNLSIKNLSVTADILSEDIIYRGTTLTYCSCQDHKFTHKPCKHMLYLAYTLSVLQLDPKKSKEICECTIEDINLLTEKKLKLEDKIRKASKKNKEFKKILDDYLLHLDAMAQKSTEDYPYFATVVADLQTYYFEQAARYLESKRHTALEEAKRIRDLKKDTQEILSKKKELEYKLNYIESLFPNINDIFDSGFSEEQDFELETEKNTDRTRLFLSPEEYKTMSTTQKNQLALDRYVSNQKSKWQVGRDYEMFIGYSYEQKGYNVSYTGIIKNLEDMGRDLIVKKDSETLIVQCKNWSKEKTIHEKHIFQLFGTVVLYNLDNPKAKANGVFVSTTKLSEKAIQIAKELGIQHYQIDLGDFPRIKCNVNKSTGEKIYHLPFDQQYDSTVVKEKDGECYAFTVIEAEEKGFRRALKHFS